MSRITADEARYQSLQAQNQRNKTAQERNKINKEKHQDNLQESGRMRALKEEMEQKRIDNDNRAMVFIESKKDEREQEKRNQENRSLQLRADSETKQSQIQAKNNMDLSILDYHKQHSLNEQGQRHHLERERKSFFPNFLNKFFDYSTERELKNQDHQQENKVLDNQQRHQKHLQKEDNDLKRFLALKEIENQQQMQINGFHQEQYLQKENHHQERHILGMNQSHEIAMQAENRLSYSHKIDEDIREYIARSREDIYKYAEISAIDLRVYERQQRIDTDEKRQRLFDEYETYRLTSEVDKDKRMNEALAYSFERTVDAKLKVWVMEEELRIFGRKVSQEEVNDYVKNNKHRWDQED